MDAQNLHIVMFPWFAVGHITPFLQLSNKLAERGHRISFFVPQKTQAKFNHLNHHPDLITFIPITVPSVEGVPPGAETTADVQPLFGTGLLTRAMDLTQPTIRAHLLQLQPDFVFYDYAYWLPRLARELGIKAVYLCVVTAAIFGYLLHLGVDTLIAEDLMNPPPHFPPTAMKLRASEAREIALVSAMDCGDNMTYTKRMMLSLTESDAICMKSSRELEGPICEYIGKQLNKQIFLVGPVVPEIPNSVLEEQFQKFLDQFEDGKVIFCALGSECTLSNEQFQEVLFGLEQAGLPFIAALKLPSESAMPEGFEERVKGKGLIYGGWIQQQLILKHPSVGCFVTHCGCSSLSEAMVNKCQIVLFPQLSDQMIYARFMGGDLKVGIEVERGEEDGLFTREGVCKAIKAAMDEDSEIGKEVRANHTKWREFLLSDGLENSYLDEMVKQLHSLLTVS